MLLRWIDLQWSETWGSTGAPDIRRPLRSGLCALADLIEREPALRGVKVHVFTPFPAISAKYVLY